MLKSIFLLFILCCGIIQGANISIGSTDASGNRSCILENKFVKAEFTSSGGRLMSLIDKRSGKELTWAGGKKDQGAFKDQFPPRKYDFTKVQYEAKIIEDSAKKVTLELQSPTMSGEFQFLKINRRISLYENEARLLVDLTISNQKESMAPTIVNYWQHNFFGVKDEDNHFIIPLTEGIFSTIPDSENNTRGSVFYSEPIRPWVAMLGTSGNGIVILPEYKRFELAYSWYCKGSLPLDTMEWRMIPEEVQDGSSLRSSFQLGLLTNLKSLNGASPTAAGNLEFSADNSELIINLQGFRNAEVSLKVLLSGKEIAENKVLLEAGKASNLNVKLPPLKKEAEQLIVEVWENSKMIFDLLAKTPGDNAEKITFTPLSERNKAAGDEEDWQFDLSDEVVTEHFKWQNSAEKEKIIFLVPTDGARDIIEMEQRFNIEAIAPTVFPRSYNMGWRIKTNMPIGANETGVSLLPKIFDEKEFSAFVIGSRPNYQIPIKWTDYPPQVRNKILTSVKDGKALILINPLAEDAKLKELLAGLNPLSKELMATMDFSAAPHFSQSTILQGQYGKGKVVVIKYPCPAFIAPHTGYRNPHWALLKSEHRFQEYQFAILGKLLHWSLDKKTLINSAKLTKDKLLIDVAKNANAKIDFFGRYSQALHSMTLDLQKGENSINCPILPQGTIYAHIRVEEDFAFASTEINNKLHIKEIKLAKSFDKNEMVKGEIQLSDENDQYQIEQEIHDNVGRLLYKAKGSKILWKPENAVQNRHILTVKLLQNNTVLDERQQEFFLPNIFNISENFANLLWTDGDCFPEYSYPYRQEQKRQFGFNYLYAASKNDTEGMALKFANCETGSNWHCNAGGFHNRNFANSLKKWFETHDTKFLVDPICKNDPKIKEKLTETDVADRVDFFASKKIFQFGDEMSITHYNYPYDTCFCDYCLPKFREWLQGHHSSLDALNQAWKTSFETWDEVRPMPYGEAFLHASPAPWVEHRLYVDGLFVEALQIKKNALQEKYSQPIVGPTGVNNPPHVYGGNWNFWNMRIFDCASYYGTARIPLSFNRDNRLLMQYRGYSTTENQTRYNLWQGLFCGERSTNQWHGPTFILPDLRMSQIRNYYKDLLWELRSGTGDLLFHSKKVTNQVAILHSQTSLIANFLKQKKADYYGKQLSFATALEDLGLAYRFIAPQEIKEGILSQFQALILPEASSLSDTEITEISNFVANGGTLIADYEAGTLDEYCNWRKESPLDEIFGIICRRFSLGKVKQSSIPGLEITQAGRGITVTTGKAIYEAEIKNQKTPLFICNNYGKGKTAYLNFVAEYNTTRSRGQDKAFRTMLKDFLQIEAQANLAEENIPIHQASFVNNENYYFAFLPEPLIPNWQQENFATLKKASFQSKIELFRNGYLYDIRKGKYLGKGNETVLDFIPGDATLLALLPYRVRAIDLKMPKKAKKGEKIKIVAKIKSNGKTAQHVLLFTVEEPNGKNNLEYREIVNTENGEAEFYLPFALNDQKGNWKVSVKDAASGVTKEKIIKLRE